MQQQDIEHSHDWRNTMKANRFTLLVAVTAAVCVTATTSHAQVKVTTSGGDVATVSQKNVVDHMIVGDSLEVEAAQLAMTRTQNAAVKDFANMLITDHKSHLDNLRKLAGKSDIGREANSADQGAVADATALAQLQSMSADSGFDKAFVTSQIENHQREIAALKTLRSAAKDDDLQKDIDATLPVLDRHLARAQAVAAQLGTPANAAAPAAAGAKPPTDANAANPADAPKADKTPDKAPNAANSPTAKPMTDSTAAKKPAADSAAAKKTPPTPPKPPTI
jgi:putative membrane protein